ncbi:MAG: glutamate--tRNA ligase family protein [Actinomycetota bacterium]|nr:glutamate--tRNA ligase family protein [Actinomycetota bacterium]
MRTRFAPTPSGYLHAGNLVNAQVTSWLTRQHGGQLALRVDDDDRERYQPEYANYIFASLNALGIDWQIGPPSLDEYLQCDLRIRHRYLRNQLALLPAEMIYACECTRTLLVERACPCRELQLEHVEGETVLRVYVPDECVVEVNGQPIAVKSQLGDFVLWRRDGIPAFHWANVIDDRDLGITHVVRGSDLQAASAAHIYLARLIGAENVANAVYLHHALVRGSDGRKLSKSKLSTSTAPELDARQIARIKALARTVAEPLGITPC